MNQINLYQICKNRFCSYGINFKVLFNCFNLQTGECILSREEINKYLFVCPRCSLKAYLDYNIAFCNRIIWIICIKIDNDDDDVVITKVQPLHPRDRLRRAVAKLNRENDDDVIITKFQPVHPSNRFWRIVARMNRQNTTFFV